MPRPWWSALLHLADLRSRYSRLPYGDQAIFLRREVFQIAGGFPEIPLMEDLAFSRKLRALGVIRTIPFRVTVSGRRFIESPIYYTLLVNVFPFLFRFGVPASVLAQWYGDVRGRAHRASAGGSPFTVWITGAAAPPWLARSRLVTDARGFLTVDGSLQSVSHPWVLAAGDVASLASRPVPKAGVYAVRQGPVLAENLMRLLREETPLAFKPQRRFLSLLSLGERRAVASWGNWAVEGAWVWKLKDHLDRAFMRRYELTESTRQR